MKPYIAVLRLSHPVMFEHMAAAGPDVPAQLVVNLGIERDRGQVAVLQQLMNIFMDADKSRNVMSQTTREGMVHVLMSYFD